MLGIILGLLFAGFVTRFIIKSLFKASKKAASISLETTNTILDTANEYLDPKKIDPSLNCREDRIRNNRNAFIRNNNQVAFDIRNKISTH